MSSDLKVTNIKHESSGSNNLVLGSDGTTTVSGALTASGGIKVADGGTIGSASDTDAITIDSSGNVLVGKTTTASGTSGHSIYATGAIEHTRDSNNVLYVNRTTNDGSIIELRKDGTTRGSIGVSGTNTYIVFRTESATDGVGLTSSGGSTGIIIPADGNGASIDNHIDLGSSGNRWDDIYATNGTIQTSDRNEKQDIEELTEAEQRVAVACKGLMRKFRWIDKVAEKGDDARIHFGIIAQDLQDAFTAEGLDAHRYAMFISTTWWETQTEVPAVEAVAEELDEEGNVITEAVEAKDAYTRTDTFDTAEEAPEGATERTRLGVRYPELLAFIISAI